MRLRKLERKDAPLMLEWMHDKSVVEHMHVDFASKTLDDCIRFIEGSQKDVEDLHRAITDDEDQYLGTVSLKGIDTATSMAEFAICVRRCAMSRGIAIEAMKAILNIGFHQLTLKKIFWYVDKSNLRALRFYDKNGYIRCSACEIMHNIVTKFYYEKENGMVWYMVKG